MKPKNTLRSFLCIASSAVLAISYSQAAPVTWDITPGTVGVGDNAITGGLGTWDNTNGNWTTNAGGNNIAWDNAMNDTAIFGDTAGTVSLGTGITVGGLQFDTAGYQIQTNTLTFGAAGNIVANADATVSSIVAGSVAVNKTGSGMLTLGGGNTYTGALTLTTGTLRAATNANALGTGVATLTINGGTLEFFDSAARNYARNTTVGGSATIISNRSVASQPGVNYTLGTLSIGAHTVDIEGGSNVNSGGAAVTFGATTLTGAATFNITNPINGGVTGLTLGTVANGGNLLTFNGSGVPVNTGDITGTGGLTLTGGVRFFGNLPVVSTGNITLNGGVMQAVGATNYNRALGSGVGQIQILGGSSGFGDNGFAGATVNFGNAGATVQWDSAFFSPSTLVLLTADSQAVGPGTVRNAKLTFVNGLDLNGANRTISVGQADNTIIGNGSTITGAVIGTGLSALTKSGVGRLTLSNVANTYNNGTIINGGTLRFSKLGSMPATGLVAVNTSATLGVAVGGTSEWTTGTSGNGTIGGLLAGLGGQSGSTVSYTGNVGLEFIVTGSQAYSGNIGNVGTTLSIATFGTSAGLLVLSGNNTYSGGTFLNGGANGATTQAAFGSTLSISAANNLGDPSGALVFRGGILQITGTGLTSLASLGRTVTFVNGMFVGFDIADAANTFTVGQVLNQGVGNLLKLGAGTLVLNQANTYTGNTTIQGGGGVVLDYTSANNSKLSTGGALTLNDAGTITLKNGTAFTQIVGSTALNAGHTAIIRDGGSNILRLNAIARGTGGTISFGAASIAQTDTGNSNSILGGWATLGNDWAINSTNAGDGLITAYAGYTPFVNSVGAATTNYLLNGTDALGGGLFANSLKITNSANSQSLDLGANNLTITAASATSLGGILYAGGSDNLYSITGSGRIVPSVDNQELIFAVNTGTLSVGAFVGAASASSPVTKTGAGTLVLSAGNSYTGATRVNQGTLALGANDVFALTPFVISNATLDAASFDDSVGTLDVTANATINLGANANLAFAASNAVDWTGGKLNLTGNLNFGGGASSSLRFGTTNTGLTATQLRLISATGYTDFALDASGYLTATSIGGSSAYETWADTNAPTTGTDPSADEDGDGVTNGVEFVLGGTIGTNDLDRLPVPDASGSNLTFTFERDVDSIDPKTALFIETSTDLATWNTAPSPYTVGADTAGSTAGVTVTEDTPPGFDTVTLTVLKSPDAKKFARLKVVITP